MRKNNQVYTYSDKDYPKVVNFEINENLTFVQRQGKALNLVLDALTPQYANTWTDIAWKPTKTENTYSVSVIGKGRIGHKHPDAYGILVNMTFPGVNFDKACNILLKVSERAKFDNRMHNTVVFHEDDESAFFYSRSPKSNFAS